MNTEEGRILLAPSNGPRPGDFELGSPQSRAAARRMLLQRMEGRVRREVIIRVKLEKPRADEYGKNANSEEFSRLVAIPHGMTIADGLSIVRKSGASCTKKRLNIDRSSERPLPTI
jgi:hypothetical protein